MLKMTCFTTPFTICLTCSSSIFFLGTWFGIFYCLHQISESLEMTKDSPAFLSDCESLLVCMMRSIIKFWSLWQWLQNVFSVYLFLHGNTELLTLLLCIVDVHIGIRITWQTVVFIWALGVGFRIIIVQNFVLGDVSKIRNLLNKLLSVFFEHSIVENKAGSYRVD